MMCCRWLGGEMIEMYNIYPCFQPNSSNLSDTETLSSMMVPAESIRRKPADTAAAAAPSLELTLSEESDSEMEEDASAISTTESFISSLKVNDCKRYTMLEAWTSIDLR